MVSSLIDKRIGDAYENVRLVAEKIPEINYLVDNMEAIVTVAENAPTESLTAAVNGEVAARIAGDAALAAADATETAARIAADNLKAPIASPTFTGTPAAPTATAGNNTTQIATTAFVAGALATETSARTAADATKAPLASPALTGTPTAPTAAQGTNTTQIATTAHVYAAAAAINATVAANRHALTIDITAAPYNAVADGVTVTTSATIALGSRTLTVGTAMFSAGDVGKLIQVSRVASSPFVLSWTYLTITAFYSSTSVQVSSPPYNTPPTIYGAFAGDNAIITMGTDVYPALSAAVAAVKAAGGGQIYIPPGRFTMSRTIHLPSSIRIFGAGHSSELLTCGITGATSSSGTSGAFFTNEDVLNEAPGSASTADPPDVIGNQNDHDITIESLKFNYSGGVPGGNGRFLWFHLAKRIRVAHCYFYCPLIPCAAIGGNGLDGVDVEHCYTDKCGGAGAVWDFWKGCTNLRIHRTTMDLAAGAAQAINMNAVGTNTTVDHQSTEDFCISENRIYLNGGPAGGLSAVLWDPLSAGSKVVRGRIINNTVIGVTGSNNIGFIGRGNCGHVQISGNILINIGQASSSGGVILVGERADSSTASLSNPMTTTELSSVVTLAWTGHKIDSIALANGVSIIVPAMTVGGITFTGSIYNPCKVLSIVDENTITIQAPSAATSSTVGGTGSYKRLWGYTYGCHIQNNLIIDPIRTGQGVITAGGSSHIVTGNQVIVTSGSPAYATIVQVMSDRNTGMAPCIVGDNGGPSGSGVIAANTGDGRVCWVTAGTAPIVRDTNTETGVTRHPSPVEFASLRVDSQTPASAAATGVAKTIAWDSNYLYVCTATNTWKRAALATW